MVIRNDDDDGDDEMEDEKIAKSSHSSMIQKNLRETKDLPMGRSR
jgi:hypothetical protein